MNQVDITVPGTWTLASPTDIYSLVNDATATPNESWTTSGTYSFVANVGGQMPIDKDGQFVFVFSTTPAATGPSNFTVVVTDQFGVTTNKTATVTVNPYGSGGLNADSPSTWREIFQ